MAKVAIVVGDRDSHLTLDGKAEVYRCLIENNITHLVYGNCRGVEAQCVYVAHDHLKRIVLVPVMRHPSIQRYRVARAISRDICLLAYPGSTYVHSAIKIAYDLNIPVIYCRL